MPPSAFPLIRASECSGTQLFSQFFTKFPQKIAAPIFERKTNDDDNNNNNKTNTRNNAVVKSTAAHEDPHLNILEESSIKRKQVKYHVIQRYRFSPPQKRHDTPNHGRTRNTVNRSRAHRTRTVP
jgi:hypothetical protein